MKFVALTAYIASATALGINCRGSGFCGALSGKLYEIHDQISDMVDSGNGDRWFNDGDQIACTHGRFHATCAFFQNGASGTAQDALTHVQNLLDHGCTLCGSDPTQDGNDVSTGELTVNVVGSPCCTGNCQC